MVLVGASMQVVSAHDIRLFFSACRRDRMAIHRHSTCKSHDHEKGKLMILTTTPTIEGHAIVEYKPIVFGEVVSGVNVVKDMFAGARNFFGGRSQSYEDELMKAREQALNEMAQRAQQYGANAVVGVDIDYETLGEGSNMLMVTASGTAVVVS